MPLVCEATCADTDCAAVIDPREWPEIIIRKEIASIQNSLTDPEPKAVVLETHWTPYSPCPTCGEMGWTNLKYTRYVTDSGNLGDVTEA